MHRNRVDTDIFCHLRNLNGVQVRFVPSAANLDSEGHLQDPAHRAQDLSGLLNVFHQRRTAARLRDLGHRTAHVQIDDVGTGVLQVLNSRNQRFGRRPENLQGDRLLLRQILGDVVLGTRVLAGQPYRIDLFAGGQRAPTLPRHKAIWGIGNSGHGGESRKAFYFNIANKHLTIIRIERT